MQALQRLQPALLPKILLGFGLLALASIGNNMRSNSLQQHASRELGKPHPRNEKCYVKPVISDVKSIIFHCVPTLASIQSIEDRRL